MSFFAHTVCQHLQRQIEKVRLGKTSNRKMIVMIPAMPEQTLSAVAEAITSYCLKDHSLKLTLKIAAILTQKWSPGGRQLADTRGWSDEQGNLTCYRNIPEDKERFSLVVLCGADRVTDAASLADFHTCDPTMIWNTEMNQSFRPWVVEKLKSIGLHDFEDDLTGFDRIIKPILQCGRGGDLLQISDWLETVNLDYAENVSHAQRIMLGELQTFGLPLLARFPLQQKRKSLSLYINKSAEFFNYTLFLEARQRDKAIKAVDKILKTLEDGDPVNLPLEDEDICGPYLTGEEFLNGLKKFIQSDDQDECKRLLQCDFFIIWDKILKFKKLEPIEKKESVRKLNGNPVEVILTATWMALKDFYLENKSKSEIKIEEISITSNLYKHDVESGDDVEENQEQARDYLTRLIGGIDNIFLGHLNLKNADGSEINIASSILNSEIAYRYGKSAEPVLEFTVTIFDFESDKEFKRKFGWRLPEHHMYRLSVELLLRARLALANLKDIHKLPVFHISYYEELLQATADEEIRRVLLHSIRDERDNKNAITNLFSGTWSNEHDAVSSRLKILAEKYDGFIQEAVNSGLYSSIFAINNSWSDLRKAFMGVFEEALKLDDLSQSSVVGMLTRIFLIIQPRPERLGITWHADYHEKSGVATILHPAVIEMLEAQVVYLTRCFNYAVNKQLSGGPSKESFKAHVWRTYVDLSEIQSPLTGLLFNEQHNLDANVRGQELIHRIGSSDTSNTPLSTRLLLQYNEGTDDDSLSDTEMFRETSESKLLQRLMQDYFDLHPHARDGLSIAIFRNKDIQPIIAAIHDYLGELARKPTAQKSNKRYILNGERRRPYAISVTLFTESNDETDVAAWVQQWKERWEAAETESKYELYRRSRFSVAHRIVEKNGLSSFQSLINQQFEADIAIFYNFIGAGEGVNRFEKIEEFDVTSRDLKFPILEKACCSVNSPAEMYRRKRVVSNRQFVLGAYHANLLHSLQSGSNQKGTLVVGAGDFTPWRELIDCLHKKAEWIICVDPNMDERLIKTPSLNTNTVREIIGFGSGVGTHGEDNYTISTEQFSLADVHQKLQASIRSLYAAEAGWSAAECDDVAKGVLRVATRLSGLSLIRATGVGDEYIRDFMAYSLSRIMLNSNEDLLCESLVSLDAYRHWFDLSDDRSRPDLLWIRAKIGENNRILVTMQLVECKMGRQSKEHIAKAKSQIENGLRVLMSSFAPLGDELAGGCLEDDRPDRRYWWMQLHRLIASKTEVSQPKYSNALLSLERLAEGDFKIVWEASVFAFWINKDPDIKRVGYWTAGEAPSVTANIYEIGGGFVKKISTDFENESIDWSELDSQGNELEPEDNQDIQGDEDDDYTPWENEEESEEEENGDDVENSSDESFVEIVSDQINTDFDNSPSCSISENQIDILPSEPHKEKDKKVEPFIDKIPEVTVSSHASIHNSVNPEPLGRVLLGNTVKGGQPVYWEFDHLELANRHMLIFGASGQGKTYAIQCMLCEMTKFKQNSLIVDYTDGFRPDHIEKAARKPLSSKQHVVSNEPLPINPFLPQSSDSGGILLKEKPGDVATRIASLFNVVYHIGDQQRSVLYEAVMQGVKDLGEGMNLELMLESIDKLSEDNRYKGNAGKLYTKIKPFVDKEPFSYGEGGFDWDLLFQKEDPFCNIFQLAGMDDESGRLITEFILWDLYGHLQAKGKKSDPKVIVLDEVQNLDHKEGSPLSKYLREGRKFGVSLILATQSMSNMKKDERDRMFNAAHKLFFRPTDPELKTFADVAALATGEKANEWVGRLSKLKKGECYSIGSAADVTGEKLVSRAYKIKIAALEDRSLYEQ